MPFAKVAVHWAPLAASAVAKREPAPSAGTAIALAATMVASLSTANSITITIIKTPATAIDIVGASLRHSESTIELKLAIEGRIVTMGRSQERHTTVISQFAQPFTVEES